MAANEGQRNISIYMTVSIKMQNVVVSELRNKGFKVENEGPLRTSPTQRPSYIERFTRGTHAVHELANILGLPSELLRGSTVPSGRFWRIEW